MIMRNGCGTSVSLIVGLPFLSDSLIQYHHLYNYPRVISYQTVPNKRYRGGEKVVTSRVFIYKVLSQGF